MNDDFVKDYWNKNARIWGGSYEASWKDKYCIELERMTIAKYLEKEFKVLDVGCANGHSTIDFFMNNLVSEIVGIDYSNEMIKYANEEKKKNNLDNEKITFKTGDVRNIEFKDETFDVVYTTRVLINLPNWEEQKKGISECVRVTKKGGLTVFCEAFWEPLMALNATRRLFGLDMLVEHDFNRYLKHAKLEMFLINNSLDFSREDFSSIYYFGTRVLRELSNEIENTDSYDNDFNRMFFDIEKKYSCVGAGIQQAYIIRK